MQTTLTYNEITDYIKAHYNVSPEFTYVDSSTLKARWKPAAFVPAVSAELHIENCTAEQVVVDINVEGAIGAISSFFGKKLGLLDMLKDYLPKGVDVDTTSNHITAHLHQIEALQKVLTYADLTAITFTPTAATLTARLK
ncbi:MAG: hypothetical protein ACI4AM_04880 [Muribaculaceae bacterium]